MSKQKPEDLIKKSTSLIINTEAYVGPLKNPLKAVK